MWRNILSVGILVSLIVVVLVMNANDLFNKEEQDPNIIDVTGDTSAEGVTITAPNVSQLQEGGTAPSFSLESLAGSQLEAFDQEQDFIFLNFWATWCPPCVDEMPDLQKFQDNHQDKIQVLAVNVTDVEKSRTKVDNFVHDLDLEYPILLDEESEIYDLYSIINMPTSFIIRTEDQQIMKRINGPLTYEQMEQELMNLTEDKS